MIYTLQRSATPLAHTVAVSRPVGNGILSGTFDPRPTLPPVEDQEQTEECESYAYPFCFWAAVGFQGEQASHRALHWMARARRRLSAAVPLVDRGVTDADLIGAITLTGNAANDARTWGLVSTSVWPQDFNDTNADLPFDVVQAATPITPGNVGVLVSTGAELVAEIQAITFGGTRLKNAVALTTAVDASYENLGPGQVWRGPTGPIKGLHKTAIVGHAPDPAAADGLPMFLIRGSWGPYYGDAGYIWVAGCAITNPMACFDFVPVLGGPVL